jgi:hypothetical protein
MSTAEIDFEFKDFLSKYLHHAALSLNMYSVQCKFPKVRDFMTQNVTFVHMLTSVLMKVKYNFCAF